MAKVTVEQGTLVGGKTTTADGFEFYEFLQIPYAKPPLGDLRFKSPHPPEPWHGERDATVDDPECACLQYDIMRQKATGREDCLYLNVFTPRLPSPGSKALPVMVYIHGGGFIMGSGVPKNFNGPDYLIEHDVVVVTINYRLGPLGFLCLDIPEATGNMGLKDQVMALKWVQNNIYQFGGDKNNVTIYGISAGGASVEYLCISEQSQGLFHKAIPQSGSPLNHWAINVSVKDLSYKLAETVGCQTKDENSVLEFLLAVPADVLVGAVPPIIGFPMKKPTFFGFVPTVEKDFGNGDAFITDYPYNILKQNKIHDVPVMRGFCEFEGLMAQLFKAKLLEELMEKKDFVEFCNHHIDDPAYFEQKFSETYFDDYVKSDKDLPEQVAIDYLGDLDFSSGIWISSQLMTKNKSPVYVYMFAYSSNFSVFDVMAAKDDHLVTFNELTEKRGAGHGEDTIYTMKLQALDSFKLSQTDILTRKRISMLWTNFAKTGNPTPSTNEIIPIQWPKFNSPDWKYLLLDSKLDVKSDYNPKKMEVFKEMYEKYRK